MAFIGSLKENDVLSADPRFADELEDDPREQNPDAGTMELDLSPEQREELEVIIGKAVTGRLELSRELKAWEPNKLNARHVQMIMLKAAGMKHSMIAEILGVGESNVSIAVNHPYAQLILNRVLSYAAEQATDISARIKAHAPEMLDTIIDVTRAAKKTKPELASKNAFELLKMGGYGAVEKKETTHRLEIPSEQVGLLTQAIEESQDVTHLSRVTISGPGSQEKSSAALPSAATPPRSGSQRPTDQGNAA